MTKLKPIIVDAIQINIKSRTICYLITKQNYFHKSTYKNINT